jgi:hypothetical protein
MQSRRPVESGACLAWHGWWRHFAGRTARLGFWGTSLPPAAESCPCHAWPGHGTENDGRHQGRGTGGSDAGGCLQEKPLPATCGAQYIGRPSIPLSAESTAGLSRCFPDVRLRRQLPQRTGAGPRALLATAGSKERPQARGYYFFPLGAAFFVEACLVDFEAVFFSAMKMAPPCGASELLCRSPAPGRRWRSRRLVA